MHISQIETKLIEEIRLIPHNNLLELYSFIHFYRLGLEKAKNNVEDIMQFAGCWEDMQVEDFESFSQDVTERRKIAFLRRREVETFTD